MVTVLVHSLRVMFLSSQTDKTKMVAFRDLSELCLQQCRVALKINPIFTEYVS